MTALGAAGHRAAHQVLERGFVFADPLALAILGPDAEGAVALARERPERRPLRLFIAMRSRFAEDCARRAIREGLRQILVMGAGLDTFAYRLEQTGDLSVFELDHPATKPTNDAGWPKRKSRSPRTSLMSLTISSMGA